MGGDSFRDFHLTLSLIMVVTKHVKAMSTDTNFCFVGLFFFFWIQISVCKPVIIVGGGRSGRKQT